MRRATLVYALSVVVSVLVMAMVVSAGKRLKPPPNISGRWRITSPEDASGPSTMRVEQSGRFVRVAFGRDPFTDFRLEWNGDESDLDRIRLIALSEELSLTPDAIGAVYRLERRSSEIGAAAPTIYSAQRIAEPAHGRAFRESPAAIESPGDSHPVLVLIAQLAVIILLSRLLGSLATLIRQPRVVGEMLAGLMLGPSLLGWAFPGAAAALFPSESIPFLGLLAQLGVIFFLFVIGLELDPQLIRNRGQAALVISHVSIIAPFLLGGILTLYMYQEVFHESPQMRFASVALFMGAAMSITAFPVLARILTERNLHKTELGAVAITCAAVDDVSAWCLLAFVVGLARSEGFGDATTTTILSIAYVVLMLFAVRPFLARVEAYYDRQGDLTTEVLGVLIVVVLLSALATEAIGIHPLFGAFMAGAIMPKGTRFVRSVSQRIEQFTLIVLLPIFFAFTGLKTRIELLNTAELWSLTAMILLVACAGKFGGSSLAAAACGMKWREASAIGILMNTRGLMELVILNIGRELGVITDAVFAMMVLMALITTFLTTPILHWVYPERLVRAPRERPPVRRGHDSVLIPVSQPRSGRALARLADLVTGPANPARRVIGLHLRRAEEHEAYSAAAGSLDEGTEPLHSLVSNADALGMKVEPVSFVSLDPATDIIRTAADYGVGLVLMGFHKPIIGSTVLGGTVHRVLQEAQADVAIFADRGLPDRPASILVPYLGNEHDRLALLLASSIARHSGAAVTVLHVVSRGAPSEGRPRLDAKKVSDQVFADPSQPAPVTFTVVESSDPISVVLDHCLRFDLVLIGVDQQWGLRSQLFSWRRERIARDCPTSMLIVRRARGKLAEGGSPQRSGAAGKEQTGGNVVKDAGIVAADAAAEITETSSLRPRSKEPTGARG